MRVLEINQIVKEDSYIYYINRYKGVAVIEILTHHVPLPISFSIEINPFGVRNIEVEFSQTDINYPAIPLTKTLKTYIDEMSKNGTLPLT